MNPREVFEQYREERRTATYPGYRLQLTPHLSRYTSEIAGAGGMVAFAEIPPRLVDEVIRREIDHFARLGQAFEWKVYDFDAPATLKSHLENHGFASRDCEAFLVLGAARWSRSRLPWVDRLRIEKITSTRQLRDYLAVEQTIWGAACESNFERYSRELAENGDGVSIYCAYVDDAPVGTGRVSFPPRSRFAELNGGAVVPALRGQGIFSALLARRIEEARLRGYDRISVDAAPMSRPILLRKGFEHICWTYPMVRA